MLWKARRMSVLALLLFSAGALPTTEAAPNSEMHEKIRKTVDRSLKWVRTQQKDDGSYENSVGITSLVALSFFKSHRTYREDDGPFVRRAMEYVASNAKEDGSIHTGEVPNYHTALAILALQASENPKYAEMIKKAQGYLVKIQADEGEGYGPDDKFYGGVGYGGDERPDLSNLQFALEALQESGLPKDHVAWSRAVKFLERCQNRSESNDQDWAGNDGGFVYSPDGKSFAGGSTSYGAMSFAGLKSLIFANVSKDDPRVQDALRWIRQHYTLEEHPGMGNTSLYYYYRTFARTLSTYGEAKITDAEGNEHDWYQDLAEKLISLQKPEGYWVNENPKYWEGNPVLATSWALLALEEGLPPDPLPGAPAPTTQPTTQPN